MLWFVNFLFFLRQEPMDLILLPMVVCAIQTLVCQTSADLRRFLMPRQSGLVLFIRSGCLDKSLNSCARSLFPPSMLNITCGVLLLMVRPLLHVLVGPSKNNGFRSIFLLSHNDIFHACVLVFFVTTKFQSFSQVFEFYICQDLSDKITQLTFFPQG